MASDYGVQANTELLRASTDPFWERLRELLIESGVDPQGALLAACWPDEEGVEAGYVVTPDRRVFWFSMRFGPQAQLPPRTEGFAVGPEGRAERIELDEPVSAIPANAEKGQLEEWEDITDERSIQQQPDIQAALRMIDG